MIMFVCCLFIFLSENYGQCITGDVLWKKISLLRDSVALTPESRLTALLSLKNEIESCQQGKDSSFAFLLKRIGIAYYQQADFNRAFQYFKSSNQVVHSNRGNPAINYRHLISGYYLLAVVSDSLGIRSEEISALDSCIFVAINTKSIEIYSLAALYKRIVYYFDVGDYHNCIFFATICQTWSHEYASQSNANYLNGAKYESSAFGWRINSLLALKEYATVDSLLTIRFNENKSKGFTYNLGSIYSQLSEVSIQKNDINSANNYLAKALKAEELSGNIINCKIILNNIGYYIYFKHFKDADKALYYYRKALALKIKDPSQALLNSIETLNILDDIADVYVMTKQFDSAFHYFRKAYDQIGPGIDEMGILHIPLEEFVRQKKISYLTTLLLDKADAYLSQYKELGDKGSVAEALRIYKVADQLLDRIRMEQSDLESKLFWRNDSRRLYEHAIEACFTTNNIEDAVYFFEKSRSVLLVDQLTGQRWANAQQIYEQAQSMSRVRQLERKMLNSSSDTGHARDVENQLLKERARVERLNKSIRVENPLYYTSYLDTSFISLAYIKNDILKDYHALVELFSGEDAVYNLVIQKEGATLTKINKSAFDSLSGLYLSFISNSRRLNAGMNAFKEISSHLFQLVFRDIKFPKTGRIIFSPDGQYFPFEGLITRQNGESFSYFLNDYTTSYTYSARFLKSSMESSGTISSPNILGIAPVEFATSLGLASLIGSDRSLSDIQDYFGSGSSMTFKNASKNNFLEQFSNYSIIQLYTHASLKGDSYEPVLYFADSALNLSDLNTGTRPKTRLIVLAACETGIGMHYKGEGVFSFNRGFAALGVPSSVTNLWAVDNESMYKLTELFYRYLSEGRATDEALQDAKLEFLKTADGEKKLPSFWAASIMVGSNQRIEPTVHQRWSGIAAVIIGLGLIGIVIFKVSSKRKKQLTSIKLGREV